MSKEQYIKKDEIISCEECKCLLKIEDASILNVYGNEEEEDCFNIFAYPTKFYQLKEYYCKSCKKEYPAEFRIQCGDIIKLSEFKIYNK